MRRTTLYRTVLMAIFAVSLPAQTASKAPPTAGAKQTAPMMQVKANLLQLMRGMLYPASNVIFAAQNENPADMKIAPGKDPSLATDPLVSTYGGWQAVENASLAVAEAANLLMIPGRKCANGLPVPMNNPDWPKFVQGLRDAGMKAYAATQSKDQDKILDAADTMTTACANCHDKWREKPSLGDRCK